MRISVIGCGVFGAWCAKFLTDGGHSVTLVDAYGPANGRASSSDHSRVIRAGYGADEIYSRWATESRREWQWLGALVSQTLLVRTGALFLGVRGDPYLRDTHATLDALGVMVEWLSPSQLHQRFRQIDVTGLGPAVYEVEAGVIRARAAVQALVAELVTRRRVSYAAARVLPLDEQGSQCVVRTTAGVIEGDSVVFACGPWLPSVFPQAVGGRIRPTRQEVLHFGIPAGSTQFDARRLPVWIDFTAGLYGIADLDARGFKVGIDRHGPLIDPDTLERIVTTDVVDRARASVEVRFPQLKGAPLVDAHVCQYENTTTGDFIIDRHPAWSNCWIVGGGSGHGFKHGPAVGRHLANLVDERDQVHDRFALAGKSNAAARAVY